MVERRCTDGRVRDGERELSAELDATSRAEPGSAAQGEQAGDAAAQVAASRQLRLDGDADEHAGEDLLAGLLGMIR